LNVSLPFSFTDYYQKYKVSSEQKFSVIYMSVFIIRSPDVCRKGCQTFRILTFSYPGVCTLRLLIGLVVDTSG